MKYDVLDADKIVETIDRLSLRIRERFGDERGLFKVCRRLHDIAAQAKQRSLWISRPIIGLRLGIGLGVVAVIVAAIAPLFLLARDPEHMDELSEFFPVAEAGINILLLIGALILFLVTLERRIKRGRALQAIYEIRSVAHVIDMHQLTKDPDRAQAKIELTTSSPRTDLTPFELGRYLDYCTEMLSLTGKVAALYVQHFDEAVAIASANEVEQLCTGLSRKIWQKIMILRRESQTG